MMNLQTFIKNSLVTAAVLTLAAGCSPHKAVRPSKLLAHEARIDSIISKMTLEEKVDMLHGKNMFTSAGVPRLGIPDLVYADGPFGIREEMEPHSWKSLGLANDSSTFFPTGSALAATWCPGQAYQYGTGMAREARLRGKDMILGPAINLQRIPTGGRTYEYMSEDPYLNSILAVGYTRGVQDNGAAVCLKHFALNNQEDNRGSVNVVADPRTMREMYLRAFQAAVEKGDAYGVMSAYNRVNGAYCSANPFLLDTVLRQDWGFAGIVISDWGGAHSTVGCAMNGLNVEMPGHQYMGQALLDSVKAGKVPVSVINERVRELLRVRLTIKPVPANEANATMTAKPAQAKIAYEVAKRSIVLLKNEGNILPIDLSKVKKIAVIGENAVRKMALGGVGAGVKAYREITPLQGLEDRIGDKAVITYTKGYTGYTAMDRFKRLSPYHDADPKLMAEAVKAAKAADLVIFVGGDNREVETEGSDRTSIALPAGQDQLLDALAKANPHLVSVFVAGAPLDLNEAVKVSPAILMSWFNGSEGGHALADVLLGTVVPSGKLPFTFPKKLDDSPAYALKTYPQTNTGADVFVDLTKNSGANHANMRIPEAPYTEGLLVGYRWYDTKHIAPLFPFGYGLSYTSFKFANISTDKPAYTAGDTIHVSFDLSNTGKYDAEEVSELYVSRTGAKVSWPAKELKACRRSALKAGETRRITLDVPVSNLRYWNTAKNTWTLEDSGLEIQVGGSSRDLPLKAAVKI
jgi:beta-glucosidase